METLGLTGIFLTSFYLYKNKEVLSGEVVYIKSNIDNNRYLVRNLKDKDKSADTLATIAQKMTKLVNHFKENKSKYPKYQKCIDLITRRFNPRNITEGGLNHDYTTYTINKGEEISFCLRTRDESNNLHNVNLITFVALHELAHIASVQNDPGHKTDEFKENFKFIVKTAVEIGVWNYTDYTSEPVMYCGTMVNTVPI